MLCRTLVLTACVGTWAGAAHECLDGDVGAVGCDALEQVEDFAPDVRLLQFEHHLKGGLSASALAFEAAYQVQGRPFLDKAFNAVRKWAVQTWNELSAAVQRVASEIGRAVTSWAAAVVNFLKDAWNTIVAGLTAFANQIVNVAKIIGDGIVNVAKQAWNFLKNLWDCFNPMQYFCALFLRFCDCTAGSGLSIDFSTGVLGAKCVGFGGFPMPHFSLDTAASLQWPIGQQSNGKPKLPGNTAQKASQGASTTRTRPTTGLRGKTTKLPAGTEAKCTAGLEIGISAGAELTPTFELGLNLPQGAIDLSVRGTAGVYADAFVTATGTCSFTGERRFPEVPIKKVACCPVGCIAVLLQIVGEFEATGTLTGTISASAGADVTTGASIALRIADGTANVGATSPQFATRSGLDIGGSLSAKVRVALGPMLTIWPLPGVPISIYPQVNAEVRAYGELELLNAPAMAALQQELNQTRLRRRQERAAAMVQADGAVLNLAEYQDEDDELPPVGAGAIQTACVAAGINIFVTLNVTGIGLPPGFAAALDTAALVTSMTSEMIDGVANMIKLPLQITGKCLPGVSGITNALSSVVDSIASIAKDALASLASILPSISSFLSMLSDLKNLFTGKLWCKEIAQWGDGNCKSQIGCNAPDAPPPAPIMAAITTTQAGAQAPQTAGVDLGGRISATDLWAQLDKDNSGRNVCGATKHVCNAQEVTVLSVLGGIDTSTNVWIVGGFSNWDNHRRSAWDGSDATQCGAGRYPAWWAKWGPYYGRIACEAAGTRLAVGCCDDVPVSADTSNVKLSSWSGTYSTLNSLLDSDNSGANVCGGGWHVCSTAEVTVYGATRGLNPAGGWLVGSFPNHEAHRRSVWSGQDSTWCSGGRYPFLYPQWFSYFSRIACDNAGSTRKAVCCKTLQSTSRPGVMQITAASVTYNTINTQLNSDPNGRAPCASVGAAWHICNYQETVVFMATTGVDVGRMAWIVGGFPNWEPHRRSIWDGNDATQCPAGRYPVHYGKFSVYYGLVHCETSSVSHPVLCCADDGYKNINQAPTTTTPTTAITTTTTKVNAACPRPSSTWCTHAGSIYSSSVDCDGDGVADPFCFDNTGNTGFVSSRLGCFSSWPSGAGSCKATCSMATQNPVESRRVYSTRWNNDAAGTGCAQSPLDSPLAWCALNLQVGEWLQLDLGAAMGVTGVVVQGRSDHDQWVTKFSVQYSLTPDSFVPVPGTFAGNVDRSTKVSAVFPSMVRAHYVRILPETWRGHMSMRAGVLTCQAAVAVSATGATASSVTITGLQAPTTTTPTTTTTAKAALRPGMVVALRGGRSQLYCADEGARIICNRGAIGGWERFTVLDAGGGRLALRGGNANRLCADEVSRVTCNRDAVGGWESFTLQFQAGKIVSFKGGNAGQWCCDESAGVTCNRGAIGGWEQFTVECQSGC